MPQIDIVRLLTTLGTLTTASAWMDHFIVGTVVWGLLFAAVDATTTRPALWVKGLIFGGFAWLMMLVTFMPLAGAGFLGSKIETTALAGLLFLHLIYGIALGATYGFLGVWVPVKAPVILPKEEEIIVVGPNPFTKNSADINDHVTSSSPSGKTVLIIFGCLAGFFVLLVLAWNFAQHLGFE
jgi:hypothetical protein